MTENTRISGYFFLKRLIMFLFVGLFFFLGKSLIAFGADEYCPVSPAPPPVWSDGVPAPPNNNLDLSQYFYIPSVGTSSEATNTGRPDWYNRSVAVLTTDSPEQFGVMWGKPQIDLTQDFEIHAYVYLNSFSTPELPADGIAFVLHNDPDGTYAYGRQGWGLGAYGHRGSNLTRPAKKNQQRARF
ncbi:lectin-like domain-containing protein [Vagococcus acidifermentans]|uniref:Uncharacterized protein n=1 Tax=Vagococcus acidifermentans TaxID=564710 RepID=A0A430ATY7_9ENTE|nr:hypothetical protein [Vagococcus acidifermentans]RSU11510.1 hypothetical protein CBF27_08440 [Vagococcus acidifermentans]